MGYTGHNSTPPRSILVIIGGIMAWAGLVSGFLITTPELHRALTMTEEPVEMTWQELVEGGLTDNCHIRLVDVELHDANPLDAFKEILEEVEPELLELQEDFGAEQAMFLKMSEFATLELVVYPKGADPETTPAKVIIPSTVWAIEAAYDEIETSGTLTGRFVPTTGPGFEKQLFDALLADDEAEFDAIADAGEHAGEHAGDEQAKMARADEDVADEHVADEHVADQEPQMEVAQEEDDAAEPENTGLRYVYEPAHSVLKLSDAQNWFYLSFLGVTVGLVICGAGGPSIYCCIFWQGPSMLSVLGYPMRYARAGKMTRIVYAFVGISLMGYGYQQMFIDGGLARVDGNIVTCVIGYLQLSIGSAALLGAIVNTLAERLNISLEPKGGKKLPPPKMTYEHACRMQPDDAIEAKSYVDPTPSTGLPLQTEMTELATSLTALGFGQPQSVGWQQVEDEVTPTALQLGCQEMVLAEMEMADDEPRLRFSSVLADGFVIVTLSKGLPEMSAMRFGTAGVYSICQNEEQATILSQHLEQTISIAEKRDTVVVTVEPHEMTEVCLFTRRALTHVLAQYGESNVEVGDASYGRFRFPAQPIPQLASV